MLCDDRKNVQPAPNHQQQQQIQTNLKSLQKRLVQQKRKVAVFFLVMLRNKFVLTKITNGLLTSFQLNIKIIASS